MPLSLVCRCARGLKLTNCGDPDAGKDMSSASTSDCDEFGHSDSRAEPAAAPSPVTDLWITRARPMFLYVMYAMLLWALPVGLIAAIDPGKAQAISLGMTGYLNALPESLYALFGTGYLGYATLRQWGKIRGKEP